MAKGADMAGLISNRLLAVAVPIAAIFAALPQSANAIERKLLIASFENIVVIGDITVVVETGKAPSARASGDRRVLDSLKLERTGTTLRIRLQDVGNNEKGIAFTQPLLVTITNREVRDIVMSGNGKLSVSEIKQIDASKILINGGAELTIGRVVADRLTVNLVGNGKLDINGGAVRDSRVTISGNGKYKADGLATRKLRLEHNGNATTSATVAEETEIFNSGSGSIAIGGTGTCFIKKAGAAAINCAKVDGARK